MTIEIVRKKKYLEPTERSQIKAKIGPFYRTIEIYFSEGKKLELSAEEAGKFKECLARGKFCSFSEKSQSDEVSHYRNFYFHFHFDKRKVEIVLQEGLEYPTISQPAPYETTFELPLADIPVVSALINKFLESRKIFYENEKAIAKKLRRFFENQKMQEKIFIKKLAVEYNVEPSDVAEIAEKVKNENFFF